MSAKSADPAREDIALRSIVGARAGSRVGAVGVLSFLRGNRRRIKDSFLRVRSVPPLRQHQKSVWPWEHDHTGRYG